MKTRLYFDTSVFGGVYDDEFSEISILLFDKVKSGQIICVYSDLSLAELNNAPQKVKDFFQALPKQNMELVQVTQEAFELAEQYLQEKVVGKTSADDCRNIATATLNKVDYWVSWNFKHIYIQLDIRSPREIVYNEDEN